MKTTKKAYKVFDHDWSCRGYDFKNDNGVVVNTEHKVAGRPVLCENGFHYCLRLSDCFNYYRFNPNNKVAEIEVLGECHGDDSNKECSTHIKITKVLSWADVLTMVNTGVGNTGYNNSGKWNTGDNNTGENNIGNNNTGNNNTGNWNTGYRNTGSWNTGNRNLGNWNSGNRNSGNRNSGSWNLGDNNTGYFNSNTQCEIMVFNQKCSLEDWEKAYKPHFLYFDRFFWVDVDQMTAEEKQEFPDYEKNSGYLKELSYKEAFKKAWDYALPKDRIKIKDLPNFDKDVFYEISGIDVDKDCSNVETENKN